jgi:uncharacterized protein YdhG (YjbR/CyaY superfamily)
MQDKVQDVEAHSQALAARRHTALEAVRAPKLGVAPVAEETMRYRRPTYKVGGVLCSLASQKHYMSLFMDTRVVEKHRGELRGLSVGKSCIRFKRLEDLPLESVQCTDEPPRADRHRLE